MIDNKTRYMRFHSVQSDENVSYVSKHTIKSN